MVAVVSFKAAVVEVMFAFRTNPSMLRLLSVDAMAAVVSFKAVSVVSSGSLQARSHKLFTLLDLCAASILAQGPC